MHTLLTGGLGGFGKFLLRTLVDDGHRVRCFELRSPANERAARAFPGVEFVWGDLRDPADVDRAVAGTDAVFHVAFVIHPLTERDPIGAQAVNVGGTRNVIEAMQRRGVRRLIFASSYHVHPFVADRVPPITVDEPVAPTDTYAAHKIAAEADVRASGLDWTILRLSSIMLDRKPDRDTLRLLFDIPLATRMEMVHPQDAARAFANAVAQPELAGRTLFVGGGPACQATYDEFLRRSFLASGLRPLPASAFREAPPFIGDWLDTAEAEAKLRFQRHTLEDYYRSLTPGRATLLATRWTAPLVARWMLGLSPYHRRPH